MKTSAVAIMVVIMLIAYTYLAWHFGAKSVNCPPCIDSKCPSEEIWINTSYGLMHFDEGEISACPPYLMKKADIDALYERIEQEILKQRGNAS